MKSEKSNVAVCGTGVGVGSNKKQQMAAVHKVHTSSMVLQYVPVYCGAARHKVAHHLSKTGASRSNPGNDLIHMEQTYHLSMIR